MKKLIAALVLAFLIFGSASVSWGKARGGARGESATWEQNGGRGATWE